MRRRKSTVVYAGPSLLRETIFIWGCGRCVVFFVSPVEEYFFRGALFGFRGVFQDEREKRETTKQQQQQQQQQ